MSVTLWVSSARAETIELGPTIPCYQAFAELRRLVPAFARDYPALDGVLTQCESQEDAGKEWLADVRAEAAQLLAAAGTALSAPARAVLLALAGDEDG